MRISLIVATSENGVIGRDGRLPWRLSSDLRRFKRLTMGHHIVMGRKTFESIGRLLPGRISIVVTRQAGYDAHGALVAGDLAEALRLAEGDEEVFIVGGAEFYRAALPRAARIYLTRVHVQVEGDTYFPTCDLENWRLVEQTRQRADEKNQFDHSFCVYDRLLNSPPPPCPTTSNNISSI